MIGFVLVLGDRQCKCQQRSAEASIEACCETLRGQELVLMEIEQVRQRVLVQLVVDCWYPHGLQAESREAGGSYSIWLILA